MAAPQKTVRGTLVDDRGTWTVRGRVYDPVTQKTRQRAKTTGFKVVDRTKILQHTGKLSQILLGFCKFTHPSIPWAHTYTENDTAKSSKLLCREVKNAVSEHFAKTPLCSQWGVTGCCTRQNHFCQFCGLCRVPKGQKIQRQIVFRGSSRCSP